MKIVRVEKMGNSSNSAADYEEFDLKVTLENGVTYKDVSRWYGDGTCTSILVNSSAASISSATSVYQNTDINRFQGYSDLEIEKIEKYEKQTKDFVGELYAAADNFLKYKKTIIIRDDQPQNDDSYGTIYSWHYAWE